MGDEPNLICIDALAVGALSRSRGGCGWAAAKGLVDSLLPASAFATMPAAFPQPAVLLPINSPLFEGEILFRSKTSNTSYFRPDRKRLTQTVVQGRFKKRLGVSQK